MIPQGAYSCSILKLLEPVEELMADPLVSEILINGPREVWAEREGKLTRTKCAFESREALRAALNNVAQFSGRHLGKSRPILEAHLPDGSRIEAVLPPLAENGPVVAIRRFSRSTLTARKLIEFGSITEPAARYLAGAVRKKHNMVVSGGTGSGKTSLLGVLSSFASSDERIVVIEDTREVQLQKPHTVYLESRSADERGRGKITIRDLLKATLRLRPDRIVVGEVRGGEALDLLQAMNTGHGGSMTTVHANTPMDALRRLETMALMDEISIPQKALRAQVVSAIDLIVQIERRADGRRKVTKICRVLGLSKGGDFVLRSVFAMNAEASLVKLSQGKGRGHE